MRLRTRKVLTHFSLAVIATLALLVPSAFSATEIVLDHVEGRIIGDTIDAGQPARFVFRFNYTPGNSTTLVAYIVGFKLWAQRDGEYTDGYTPVAGDTVAANMDDYFDAFYINRRSLDGLGADTLGFNGTVNVNGDNSPGIPDGFNLPAFWIETTPLTVGDTICIDSSAFPPVGDWGWLDSDNLLMAPNWGGPYRFIVGDLFIDSDEDGIDNLDDNCPDTYNPLQVDLNEDGIGDICCCQIFTGGFTGNTDCSEDGSRNLSDITRLIDRVYQSKTELCCESAGNVDGDPEDKINLSDITRLIDFVYVTNAEVAICH